MRIANNVIALNSWRQVTAAERMMERSIERLSSGKRINHSRDDVAGLEISQRMQAQIKSLWQAQANIQDGISAVQVAESALGEVSVMLQRGRELAVQAANGVWTDDERASMQTELDGILAEVNRISGSTEFNSRPLLGGDGQQVSQLTDALRRSWLANSEQVIATNYGLTGDGASIKIVADPTGAGTELAYVKGTYDANGKMTNLELHVNLSKLGNFTLPNGGTAPLYDDRVIAHEMTHAIMGRNMDVQALPSWFMEGAAEFIAGADDRLAADLASVGGSTATLVNEIDAWNGTSIDYSAGYAAVKYLDSKIQAKLGAGHGIKDLMTALKGGATLDAAIAATTNYAGGTAAFVTDFKAAAGGQAFINSLNLADADVGAIGGGTAETVVPDSNTDSWTPLQHFQVVWPTNGVMTQVQTITLQVGALAGQSVDLPGVLSDTYDLQLVGVDLVHNASGSIGQLDKAISSISQIRGQLGATQNRMEHTYNVNALMVENLTAAESRISDLDMAQETTTYAKSQIMLQASTAMLAQANVAHRDAIMRLLAI